MDQNNIKIQDLVGTYSISGYNQELHQDLCYSGTLTLKLNSDNRIVATWLINGTQLQTGLGFFKHNILVIHFVYQDEEQKDYKGIAVYRCLSKDILDGFWSEKHGNPLYLGSEKCLRIKNTTYLA